MKKGTDPSKYQIMPLFTPGQQLKCFCFFALTDNYAKKIDFTKCQLQRHFSSCPKLSHFDIWALLQLFWWQSTLMRWPLQGNNQL